MFRLNLTLCHAMSCSGSYTTLCVSLWVDHQMEVLRALFAQILREALDTFYNGKHLLHGAIFFFFIRDQLQQRCRLSAPCKPTKTEGTVDRYTCFPPYDLTNEILQKNCMTPPRPLQQAVDRFSKPGSPLQMFSRTR